MTRLSALLVLSLSLAGCGTFPDFGDPADMVPEPTLLLPALVTDLARGLCVARELADAASAQVEQMQFADAQRSLQAERTQHDALEAEKYAAKLSVEAQQARLAATRAPDNTALQGVAEARDRQALTALVAAWSDADRARVTRGAAAVFGSPRSATDFARLAKTHATLFALAQTTKRSPRSQTKTLASLQQQVRKTPDLEWLYTDRFTVLYDHVELAKCAATRPS